MIYTLKQQSEIIRYTTIGIFHWKVPKISFVGELLDEVFHRIHGFEGFYNPFFFFQ